MSAHEITNEFGPESQILPNGTQHWLVQMPSVNEATTVQFGVYVLNGLCIDGGESKHRWLVNKPTTWVAAMLWIKSKEGRGRLYATLTGGAWVLEEHRAPSAAEPSGVTTTQEEEANEPSTTE